MDVIRINAVITCGGCKVARLNIDVTDRKRGEFETYADGYATALMWGKRPEGVEENIARIFASVKRDPYNPWRCPKCMGLLS